MRRQPASLVETVTSRKVSTGPPRATCSACFSRSAMIALASLRPSSPLIPALLTRMSRRGVSFLTSANMAATAVGSDTSAAMPWPSSLDAVARAASRFRSLTMTRAPSSAKRRAICAPIPRAAPVMSAVLPSSRFMLVSFLDDARLLGCASFPHLARGRCPTNSGRARALSAPLASPLIALSGAVRPPTSNHPLRPQRRDVGLAVASFLQHLLSVFARQRRRPLDAATAVGEAEARADHHHRPIACLHSLQHIAMGELGVGDDLGYGPDARAGYV